MKKLLLILTFLTSSLPMMAFFELFWVSHYKKGMNTAKGALDEISNRMESGSGDFVKKLTEDVSNGLFSGLGKSISKGGEFDKLSGEAGKAMRRGMGNVSDEIGGGLKDSTKRLGKDVRKSTKIVAKEMDESSKIALKGVGKAVDNAGVQMKETFAVGGEFDKGQEQLFDLNAKNINRFIFKVGHKNLMIAGGVIVGLSGIYFSLKYGGPLVFKMIERRLTSPKLIIESSKKSILQKVGSLFSSPQPAKPMVFAAGLEKQLTDIVKIASTVNNKIKQGNKNVKYRNLMLYGPPGTGKTMFAKELARRSGLEYAFMSGSSFSKFKDGEGIEALDELFAWAKRSKGLMIFIDEAETFLSKRENMDPQSKAYQLLNNFLNYTGERSDRFMIVFATNHHDALDSAMYRRIDDLIEMPLPAKNERINLLTLYKNKILMDIEQNGKPFVASVQSCLTPAVIEQIAEKTKGLSGGDIEGIINTIKTDTDILDPALVTPQLVDTVVERAVKKHRTFTGGKQLGFVED